MVKRRWVRASDSPPLSAEGFRRSIARGSGPSFESTLAPALVMFDLRTGNLERLDEYLKFHQGIPHPDVAMELSQLISGPLSASRYRLIAVEHPDTVAKSGPKARKLAPKPTANQLELVAEFERALVVERGKKHLAEKACAKTQTTSLAKVKRARRAVREYEAQQIRDREELLSALAILSSPSR